MMTDEPTPTVVENETEHDIDVNYWDKHGERLYCNGLQFDPYVDLETGEMDSKKYDAEIDGDRVEIRTTGYLNDPEDELVAAIFLSDDETDADEGEAQPVAEVPPEVPYNSRTAGIAQQINAQRMIDE